MLKNYGSQVMETIVVFVGVFLVLLALFMRQ